VAAVGGERVYVLRTQRNGKDSPGEGIWQFPVDIRAPNNGLSENYRSELPWGNLCNARFNTIPGA